MQRKYDSEEWELILSLTSEEGWEYDEETLKQVQKAGKVIDPDFIRQPKKKRNLVVTERDGTVRRFDNYHDCASEYRVTVTTLRRLLKDGRMIEIKHHPSWGIKFEDKTGDRSYVVSDIAPEGWLDKLPDTNIRTYKTLKECAKAEGLAYGIISKRSRIARVIDGRFFNNGNTQLDGTLIGFDEDNIPISFSLRFIAVNPQGRVYLSYGLPPLVELIGINSVYISRQISKGKYKAGGWLVFHYDTFVEKCESLEILEMMEGVVDRVDNRFIEVVDGELKVIQDRIDETKEYLIELRAVK